MKITITISDAFSCSLDRAFKAPILGDATKFLNGYLVQPPVTGFEADETWGKVGGVRYPVTKGNWLTPAGRIFTDTILECNTNHMWKWMISDFKYALMFFAYKATGTWTVEPINNDRVSVKYSYTFYSKNYCLHLFTILFAAIQWRGMMKKALKGIKKQAESNEAFIYERK